MREREAKLLVGPSFRLPELGEALEGVQAEPASTKTMNTIYLDTPDLRLARWGCSLRYREGEGWTVKLTPAREGELLVRGEHTFPGTRHKPAPEALDLLRAYIRSATLAPVVRLRTVRTSVGLTNPDGGAAGEVVDDEVSILEGSRVAARFREVEVELAEDAPDPLLPAVIERLHAAGAGDTAFIPKYVRALGPLAESPPELTVETPKQPDVAGLVRATLARSTIYLLANDASVRLGEDPEAVHEARVATRRLRSRLRTFRSVLDPVWAADLRSELGWLAGELGAVRDADVLEAALDRGMAALPSGDRGTAAALTDKLKAQRDVALNELREAMSSQRYVELLDSLVAASQEPAVIAQTAQMPAATMGSLMEGPWSRLERACRRLGGRSSDADLHRVRILAKRVRYTAESLTPAFGKRAEAFAEAAAELQGVLGDHHDAVMTAAWLRVAAAEPDTPPEVAFVAGEMTAIERRAARKIRGTWLRAWEAIDRPKLRFWR
jgi:CHAD domain-containing protein